MRWKDRSPSPARPSSGCATTSGSSRTRPRPRRSPAPSRTRAASTSSPHSPGCSPRIGICTRGAVVGLTRYVTRAHLVRATLEAICYQTKEVADAMEADSGVKLTTLKVDGGAVKNDFLMQLQAAILRVKVVRPPVQETAPLRGAS